MDDSKLVEVSEYYINTWENYHSQEINGWDIDNDKELHIKTITYYMADGSTTIFEYLN